MNDADELDQLERELGPALRVALRRVAADISEEATQWPSVTSVRVANGKRVCDVGEQETQLSAGLHVGGRGRGGRWMLVAAATIIALTLGLLAVATVGEPDAVQTHTVAPTPTPSITPITNPASPVESSPPTLPDITSPTTGAEERARGFAGTWVSSAVAGDDQSIEIALAGDGSAQLTRHEDDSDGLYCSGTPVTVTWSGSLESEAFLVFTDYELTCDNASAPDAQGEDYTYTLAYDSESDTLTDSSRVLWWREGAERPSAASLPSGGMWPQASRDEVRQAQQLADAGDPLYTWQVDRQLASGMSMDPSEPAPEIIDRFLREQLGWDEFLVNVYAPDAGTTVSTAGEFRIPGIEYLRCAPGDTNPMYPVENDNAPNAHRCAPTIDGLHYETVSLDLAQFGNGAGVPQGIWVVSRWSTIASPPFAQTDPSVSEAEATARLQDFLEARIAGQGAEGLVDVRGGGEGGRAPAFDEVPLLYATSAGAPYERYEVERTNGPWWPFGEMQFVVRLFADDGATVVEQPIDWFVDWRGMGEHELGLVHKANQTMENGKPLPVPYEFFDGQVTVSAPDPWEVTWHYTEGLTLNREGDDSVQFVRDPLPVATGCVAGAPAVDARSLARSIASDPDLVTTAPVEATAGDLTGVVIDVTTAPGASRCAATGSTQVVTWDRADNGSEGDPGLNLVDDGRMRLFLLDLPHGQEPRILAIAIAAPDARFADVTEAAAPIVESLDLQPDRTN